MTPFMTTVLLAIVMPALDQPSIKVSAHAPEAAECVGELTAERLSTTVRLRDGTSWLAPWRIMQVVPLNDGSTGVLAVLDRIVRVVEGEHTVFHLDKPLAATVRAESTRGAIQGAAELWCSTVIRATGSDRGPPTIIAGRVGLGGFSG